MELTRESNRTRWVGLIVVWLTVGVLAYLHAAAFSKYIDLLNGLALRGAAEPVTPLKRVCPTMYADAQMWVRHALALADGKGPQLRFTEADNAPFGREVHWNSGFAWLLVGVGHVRQWFTHESLSVAVEQSMAWINVGVFVAIVAAFTHWTARRAGLGAGALLGFAMIGSPSFYTGFNPNYVDHHGLLAAGTLGLCLGILFMGAGLRGVKSDATQLLPSSVTAMRQAAIFSAACGAGGMWVSAATTIPAIVITGAVGLATMIVFGGRRSAGHCVVVPEIWRTWGRWGGGLCLGFYLLEYAPFHLGLRLEVNHPLYAAGWWGGGELIASVAAWRSRGINPFRERGGMMALAILPLVLVPIIIALAGSRVFVVFDPFVTRLSAHVAEGISIRKAIEIFGFGRMSTEIYWILGALVVGLFGFWRARSADRPLLCFALATFFVFGAMGAMQIRWLPSTSAPALCTLVVAVAVLGVRLSAGLRWMTVSIAAVLFCLPTALGRIRTQFIYAERRMVDSTDAMQPIYRDMAATLRASAPHSPIVLLSSPNASVAIGYYGQFKTIGTLYWENLDGTKAAAQMFSAQTEGEARRLLRRRGVTHVAMVSTDNFLAEYFDLLRPNADKESLKRTFGYQLLVDQQFPVWLDVIPYVVPAGVPAKVDRTFLVKTCFASAPAEELYEVATDLIDAGKLDAAETKLDAALALAPDSAEFLLIKARLLLNRGKGADAGTMMLHAIELAPVTRQCSLYASEATRFYRQDSHAIAAEMYRRSLRIQFDPLTANNLVWLLATSRDAAVRNGREAVELGERIVGAHKEYVYLTAFAAALAECERFDDAITVTQEALKLAQAAKDQNLITTAEQRLTAFGQKKPVRQ